MEEDAQSRKEIIGLLIEIKEKDKKIKSLESDLEKAKIYLKKDVDTMSTLYDEIARLNENINVFQEILRPLRKKLIAMGTRL